MGETAVIRRAIGLAREHRILLAVLLMALVLDLVGIGWGLPNTVSWNVDDISPWKPLFLISTYLDTSDKYPYLHWFISLFLYAPYLVFLTVTGGWIPSCWFHQHVTCFSEPYRQLTVLMAISRALSVAMGLGIVAGSYTLALRIHQERRAALFTALIVACSSAVVFCSHVGNLDVPHTFWFVLSLIFFVQLLRRGELRDYAAFGLTAGCALATKEGILGAYVLTGLAILVRHLTRSTSGPRSARSLLTATFDRKMLSLVGSLLGLYLLVQNPLINWSGFLEHWGYWLPTGERMQGFRRGYPGLLEFSAKTTLSLRRAMDTPSLILCASGLFYATWRHRFTLVLLLPAFSYFFISVVTAGFVPVRFMLPLAPMLAVFGGLLASFLLRGPRPVKWVTVPLLVFVFGHTFLLALHDDLLMVRDSRYLAEDWLSQNVPTITRLAVFSNQDYLPRLEYLGYRPEKIAAGEISVATLEQHRPELIVLSRRYFPRFKDRRKAVFDGLLDGSLGYQIVFEAVGRTPLDYWFGSRHWAGSVSPRIIVLQRGSQASTRDPASTPPHRD